MSAPEFPALLQAFFSEYLLTQRRASPHTVRSYRDAFRLLLRFTSTHLRRAPTDLVLGDLGPALISQFLVHLEQERHNSPRSRNARLAAIHAFFRYVALRDPGRALLCQQVLAIPSKRFERGIVEFLDDDETRALLSAPDPATWIGRRDRALLLVAVQTGLRVSELVALRRDDVALGTGAHVRCLGKGRKLRCTPLRSDVVGVIRAWIRELPATDPAPLFPSSRKGHLSCDAVERLVAKHTRAAAQQCPSIAVKHITPHVLRHSAAMALLRRGVDRSVIALWLGHESMETTQIYLHADIRMKERALAHTTPSGLKPGRFRPDDVLLEFLESL